MAIKSNEEETIRMGAFGTEIFLGDANKKTQCDKW